MDTEINQKTQFILNNYSRYFDINMHYEPGANNYQKGINRAKLTTLIVIRLGIIAPVIIRWLYSISQHQALEHLNKLTKEGLLQVVKTHRSPDGRVYVPTYNAAKFAEDMMGIEVYFRSQSNPALMFNHNNVMHNLINAFIMLKGINNRNTDGTLNQLWQGFITEPEFKRLATEKDIRSVDGLVKELDECDGKIGGVISIEIEHSFKNKNTRQQLLLKYLYSLKMGYYKKVFLFSHSQQIFKDIKRLHEQLFEELPDRFDKKTRLPILTNSDVELLKSSIIYRTKFCEEITELFYQ